MSYRKEDGADTVGHPAQLVVDMLGCDDEQARKLHCGQLESWYQEYAQQRGVASLFKKPGFVSRHMFETIYNDYPNKGDVYPWHHQLMIR